MRESCKGFGGFCVCGPWARKVVVVGFLDFISFQRPTARHHDGDECTGKETLSASGSPSPSCQVIVQ